jgi:hypothetical protein
VAVDASDATGILWGWQAPKGRQVANNTVLPTLQDQTVQNDKSFSMHEQINEAEPVSSTQHVPVAYTHTPNVYALMQSPFLWLARAYLEPSGELSNLSKATLCDTQAPSRILVKIGTPTPKLRVPGCRMALVQGGGCMHPHIKATVDSFYL